MQHLRVRHDAGWEAAPKALAKRKDALCCRWFGSMEPKKVMRPANFAPIVIGIDPGPIESAFVMWDGSNISNALLQPNDFILRRLIDTAGISVAIEQIRGYGIPAGNELFDTCIWTGRFYQVSKPTASLVPRKSIVTHLCDNPRAGDKEVRAALLDKLGPSGTRKAPGATYGISGHLWSALAVAVYAHEKLSVDSTSYSNNSKTKEHTV